MRHAKFLHVLNKGMLFTLDKQLGMDALLNPPLSTLFRFILSKMQRMQSRLSKNRIICYTQRHTHTLYLIKKNIQTFKTFHIFSNF